MISVIIPTYNREKTLYRSVKSVLNQSFQNIELIIVDDGSTDNTEKLVRGLQDNRIRYIRHAEQMGACAARNTGIRAAHGEYISFQDSDDFWYPEKLDRQLQVLKVLEADICFCRMRRNSSDGTVTVNYPKKLAAGIVPYETLISHCHASTQTIFARAEVCQKYEFDTALKSLQDYDWNIRAGSTNKVVYVDEVLVEVFLQNDSITSSDPVKKAAGYKALLQKHISLCEKYPSFYGKMMDMIGMQRVRMKEQGIEEFHKAYKATGNKKYLAKDILYKVGLLELYYNAQRGRIL